MLVAVYLAGIGRC